MSRLVTFTTLALAAAAAIAATMVGAVPGAASASPAPATAAHGPRAGGRLPSSHHRKASRTQFNTLWSGYAAIGHVTSVSASWTQAAVKCLPGSTATAASPWVGIDGATNASNNIEQTGTEGNCNGHGKPTYDMWWEMFPGPVHRLKAPVRPGDHLQGSVTWDSGHTYTLKLSNLTQHWVKSETESLKAATNVSAEAILEENATEFSDFGTVTFQNVTVDGKPIGDYTGKGHTLARIELANAGHHVCETTSPLSGKQDFTETWHSLCADSGVVAGYSGDKQQAFDVGCKASTATITGHPQWVTNLCAEFSVPKDVAEVRTGKSFKQCHTLTFKNPTLQLHGQPAKYTYPAKCPA